MNNSNAMVCFLAVAMLVSVLSAVAPAHSGGMSTSSSGGSYYSVLGSNVTGADTIFFDVNINSANPQITSYYVRLVLAGNPNQVVNQTTIQSQGSQTQEELGYEFHQLGTYQLYTSIEDNLGDVSNTSINTVTVLQALVGSMTPSSSTSMEGHTDSLNVQLTDNFRLILDNCEPSSTYYIYQVVQTAPDGSTSTIAVNQSGGPVSGCDGAIALGQKYNGGYTIPIPAFTESGTYSYTIYVHETAAGTTTTASTSISVAAAPTTSTVSSTSTSTSTVASTSTVGTTSTVPPNGFNFSSSPQTYYVIIGSTLPGASTLFFDVNVNNLGSTSGDSYTDKLIMTSPTQQTVNQIVFPQTGRITPVETSYKFPQVGTYLLYTSITDARGFTGNTAPYTVYAVQGLLAQLNPSSSTATESQSAQLNLNITDNFGLIRGQSEGNGDAYVYRVVQTAPNGTSSTVASSPNGGQPYTNGYTINTGTFNQAGRYSYTAYVTDSDDGTNATATATITVASNAINATTTIPPTTTVNTTTTIQPTGSGGGGGGGCGLCTGGNTAGLPPPTTVTTTIIPVNKPTTTVPQTAGISNTSTSTSGTGTPQSTTVTVRSTPGSSLTPPSLTTTLFIVIIALLAVILALLLFMGKRGGDAEAAAAGALRLRTSDSPDSRMAAGTPKQTASDEEE